MLTYIATIDPELLAGIFLNWPALLYINQSENTKINSRLLHSDKIFGKFGVKCGQKQTWYAEARQLQRWLDSPGRHPVSPSAPWASPIWLAQDKEDAGPGLRPPGPTDDSPQQQIRGLSRTDLKNKENLFNNPISWIWIWLPCRFVWIRVLRISF